MNPNIIQKRICISLCKDYNKVELECVIEPITNDVDTEELKQEMIEEARQTLYQITNPPQPKFKNNSDKEEHAPQPATEKQVQWCKNLGMDPIDLMYLTYDKANEYIRKNNKKK